MSFFRQEVHAMATMNVSLPDLMKEWVEDQIKTGHFSNASDYVRDLIRRDQEYQDRREMLIKALIVGENSRESERSIEDIWQGVKARHGLDV
jgi:antitoxin ParD1/3/4